MLYAKLKNTKLHPPARQTARLCLVRHGETPWNAEQRMQGHIDIPLNPTGEAQARATAAGLAGTAFAALYSSDLSRARQTAAAIEAQHGLAVSEDARLRERHYGLFQGLTYDEAARLHPEPFRRFMARERDFTLPEFGESLDTFAARVRAALEDIAGRHPGEQVLVVTHGGVLDIAHRLAAGKELTAKRDFAIPNAALNWIEHEAGAWRLLAWADRSHLEDARDELSNG